MKHQIRKNIIIFLSFVMLQGYLLSGCSVIGKLQRSAGLRKHTIKIANIGSSYKSLKDTEFDFFSTKKKVKKLTKHKPVIINYHSFKMKKLDNFIKKTNVLFGQYKFADLATKRFESLMVEIYGKGFLNISEKEMKKKNAGDVNVVKKVQAAYKALKLSLQSTKDIAVKAKDLLGHSSGLIKDSVSKVKGNPTKAILIDKVLGDTKHVITRLKEVMTGTPNVVKRLAKYTKVMNLLAKI